LEDLRIILEQFDIAGRLVGVEPLQRGHINQTYVGRWDLNSGSTVRFLHQKINTKVFKNPSVLMRNIKKVSEHINKQPESALRCFEIVAARSGGDMLKLPNGEVWRTLTYIENSVSYDSPPNLQIAREAGRGCGLFLKAIAGLGSTELEDVIPGFHDATLRYDALRSVIQKDPCGRVRQAQELIDVAFNLEGEATILTNATRAGKLPIRAVHNDTKLNNILFCADSGQAIALIDLDTCMGGASLYDFGDLMRTVAPTVGEDSRPDLPVEINREFLAAGTEGFLQGMSGLITDQELQFLSSAPAAITLIIGVRFLTDFIGGDGYFQVERELQNLDRARTQLAAGQALLDSRSVVEQAQERFS